MGSLNIGAYRHAQNGRLLVLRHDCDRGQKCSVRIEGSGDWRRDRNDAILSKKGGCEMSKEERFLREVDFMGEGKNLAAREGDSFSEPAFSDRR